MAKKRPTLDQVRETASFHLAKIQDLFMPGMKVTVLVRQPDAPDGSQDFMLTNDDVEMVIAALRIRQSEESARV